MAASQDRTVQGALQPILSRTIAGNQSVRSGLPLQPLSNQPVTSSPAHILSNQTVSQNVGMSGPGQDNSGLHVQPNQQQQQQHTTASQSEEHVSTPNYGTPLSHFNSGQKSYSMSHSVEDRELQRRMDEVKRKQAEYEENQKKQEEQQLQSQQQTYQPNHSRSQLHPGMLRLDNLIINGPNVSMR